MTSIGEPAVIKPKIRVRTIRYKVNGAYRYMVIDHLSNRWIEHSQNHYIAYDSMDFMLYSDDAHMEEGEQLERLLRVTGGSEGEALERHAPLPKYYDILPPDTVLTKVSVERTGHEKPEQYICLSPLPFEVDTTRTSEFYTLEDLRGQKTFIRYAAIENIEFKTI